MNLLELFKSLTEEQKEEFIALIIEEINKKQEKEQRVLIIT